MKKIITTCIMATLAMSSFAQAKYQQYFRIEFTVPIVGTGTGSNTSVAATMKDNYTYCNPEHQYLDFPATNNPCWFDNNTHNYTEYGYFYFKTHRAVQGIGNEWQENFQTYDCDKIKKITAYSIPVEKITCDSTKTYELTKANFPGDMNKQDHYRVADFTFNRLPRNVAELKTLMENPDGTRIEACKNPLFIGAVSSLIWPRLLDCSQDCRDMWDYLYGREYTDKLGDVGISNTLFQDECIGHLQGKGSTLVYKHYYPFCIYGGATPGNAYKINGKGYTPESGPIRVRVGWYEPSPLVPLASKRCDIATLVMFPNPDEKTNKNNIGFEDPYGMQIQLRSTNKNGWFFYNLEKNLRSDKTKDPIDDDF